MQIEILYKPAKEVPLHWFSYDNIEIYTSVSDSWECVVVYFCSSISSVIVSMKKCKNILPHEP